MKAHSLTLWSQETWHMWNSVQDSQQKEASREFNSEVIRRVHFKNVRNAVSTPDHKLKNHISAGGTLRPTA